MQWIIALAVSAVVAASTYAWTHTRRLTTMTHSIDVLPEGASDITLVHLSDTHGSHTFRFFDVHAVVSRIRPDIIAMTGDLVGASDDIESGCKALAELASICCVFFVPGNHDIVASSRTGSRHRVETLLSKSGVRVLLNRQENDIIRGTRVVIAGVDDLMRGAPDLSIAEAAPGEAGLRILLSHNPDVVLSLPRDSWDLLLCGHTHGGQIRLPLVGPVTTNSRTGRLFWKQPVVFRGIRVFMSQGLGTTLLPIRLLCSPRIDVLKLRSCQRIESAEH